MHSHHMKEIEAHFDLRSAKGAEKLRASLAGVQATFVCFTNRVGSNYFTDVIGRAGMGVRVAEEDFNSASVISTSIKNKLTSFVDYLAFIIERTKNNNTLFLKIGAAQLLWMANRGLLGDFFPNCRFVYLRRRDKIAQAVSLFLMNKTGRHLASDPTTVSENDIEFDEVALAKQLKWIVDNEAVFDYFFALHRLEPFEIFYEEFTKSPGSHLVKLADFCGVKPRNWLEVGAVMKQSDRITLQRTKINNELSRKMEKYFEIQKPSLE